METRSPEKRKASRRISEPETPDATAAAAAATTKKTKVRKIHARRSTSNVKDPGTPVSQSSDHASPAPFQRSAKDAALPTRPRAAAVQVNERNLQSIAESGVLATSLARSRTRWITQGIFEHYWTKPKTVRGVVHEPPKNPPKDSMQKLGKCRISIEPHVFDATLFAIREPAKPVSQPPQQAAAPKLNQTAQSTSGPVQAPAANEPQSAQVPTLPPPPAEPSKGQTEQLNAPAASTAAQPVAQPTAKPVPAQTPQPTSSQVPQSKPAPTPPIQTPQQKAYNQPMPPIPKPVPGQDPVILMLAQRASTDADLKVLMKIVASGQASKDQLAVFQGHIDELQAILQRHNQMQAAQPAQMAQTPYPRPPHTVMNRPPQAQPYQKLGPVQFSYQSSPVIPPAKVKAPAAVRLDITGVCMEFEAANSSDRLLFPRQSVLEFFPGNLQAKASFLVVRRGDGSSPDFELGKSYFQPVTALISADLPRVIEPLARAVAPLDQVRKSMEETMAKMKRAPVSDLVLRTSSGADADVPGDAGATPTADKRAAFTFGSAATPSSGQGRKKKHHDEFEQSCRYCFDPVAESQGRDDEGLLVCRSCQTLRIKNGLLPPPRLEQHRRAPLQAASGPRVLMFAAG